ncbi:MAG TPA: DUF58 domain-containing protein [Anaerolineales bacterium]|nr:DUF58 domain-containing protein [Anaerolineales bacterium]
MSRAWFLGLIAFGVLVSGFVTLNGSQLALVIPIVLYWAYALSRAPTQLNLEVHRTLSAERVAANAAFEVRLDVLNAGEALEELILDDMLPAGLELVDGSLHHLVSLGRHARFSFSYIVRGARGAYAFGEIRAQASDALGLVPTSGHMSASAGLHVMPVIDRVQAFPIRPRRTRVYSGVIPARVGGAGVEFYGVRSYSPGDVTRRINWRLLARHPESLYCNEFQQERVADVAIVLDGRERANLHVGGDSLFEHSVSAAGSIASAFLEQGNRVGLLVYSHFLNWTFPGYGKVQRERILRALALAAPGASQIFEGLQYLPTRLFSAEAQIVLISPLLENDLSTIIQLRARGHQVAVMVPDPVAFELRGLPRRDSRYSREDAMLAARIVGLERRVLLERLRRGGVQVIEWDVSTPLDQTMRVAARQLTRWRAPA